MPDNFMCPECQESHDGPGVCSECNKAYIDLTEFDLDDAPKAVKSIYETDPLSLDESADNDGDGLMEAA